MMRIGTHAHRGLARGLLLAASLLLAACATTTVVREEPPRRAVAASSAPAGAVASPGPTHRVQAGDTLYQIAFRNGLDWRDVARWNSIPDPYVIRPGQVLRLSPGGGAATAIAARSEVPAPAPASRPAAGPATSEGVVGRVASGRPPPIPRGPAGSAGGVGAPATPPPAPPAQPAPAAPRVVASTPAAPPVGSAAAAGVFRPGQWQWPTEGQVVSRFAQGDRSRQGIAIAGTAGQPVRAAAAGTVVYSGAGLVGYGELIIIKHSDEWLSAYGHNRRRLVAEGASVAAGQQIAELGRTGTSRDMLHFEIRRNGRPVDPAPLLPRR